MPNRGQPVSDEHLPVEEDRVEPLPEDNIDLSALFGEGGAEFGLANIQTGADKDGDGSDTDDTAAASQEEFYSEDEDGVFSEMSMEEEDED